MTETLGPGERDPLPPGSFVLVVQHKGGVRRYPLDGTHLLGKHPENDVVLDEPGVSRYHLEIRTVPSGVLFRDAGSKNGTFYNGARITELLLSAGSVLRLGGPAGIEISIELAHLPSIQPAVEAHFGPLVGRCLAMRSLFTMLSRTAPSTATVLILGETGTGKELVAQAIHQASPRRDGPLVIVDCGSIPANLIETELFGHKKGAFTDAQQDRLGAFETASGGSLFLDEIGELPIELQPKILRAVESRTVQRVGETSRRPVDVRLIAATHRDLAEEVQRGRFRQDLFFRLAVVTVRLPPLRDRGDDVLLIAERLLSDLGHPGAIDFRGSMSEALLSYSWPGNVRELRNALERAIHLGAEHAIPMPGRRPKDPAEIAVSSEGPSAASPEDAPDLPFKEAKDQLVARFERAYIERLMGQHEGNISGASRAAGIDRNYLYRLLKKHGLG